MAIGIYEFITLKNDALIELGVPSEGATARREQMTGHRVRLSPFWARTVGCWGGACSLREIASVVDRDMAYVKTYARTSSLRYSTRALKRTPAQLAATSFAALPAPATVAARALGLYPAEVCLYRAAMSRVLAATGASFCDVLRWSPAELETCWDALALSFAKHGPHALDAAGGPS